MKTVVRNHMFASYYLLACVITSIAVAPIITSSVSVEFHPLGALGPILAASIVTTIALGHTGLSRYLRSLTDTRFSTKLALLSISPLIFYFPVASALTIFNRQMDTNIFELSFNWWISMLIASVAYGIGEEAGWRGFALPRLQARWQALVATFILTIFHALWHFPFFFYRLQFGFGVTIGFFLGMLAGAICMAYLYNESGGKTLLPILFHTTWNIVSQIALATQPEVTYVLSTVLMAAALMIVIVFRPSNLASRERYVI